MWVLAKEMKEHLIVLWTASFLVNTRLKFISLANENVRYERLSSKACSSRSFDKYQRTQPTELQNPLQYFSVHENLLGFQSKGIK